MITLVQPDSARLWTVAKGLVEEYAATLHIRLDFQDFARELQEFTREYGPPNGVFLLAREGEEVLGCGAVRRFSASECELKRMYVPPQHQRRGIGRMLATALISRARALGYECVLLDTLPSMHAAHALYRSFGFEQVPGYRFNPVPGATFWKLDL